MSGYSVRMSGYTARMSGYSARMSGYSVRMSGYTARMSVYTVRMSGYSARMSGFISRLMLINMFLNKTLYFPASGLTNSIIKIMPSRVPQADSEFDQYIRNTTEYLLASSSPANWERLGLEQAEMDAWEDFLDEWKIKYPLYTNDATRTKTITQDKNDTKNDFTAHAQPLLDIMAVCRTINNTDRNTLRIPARDTTPTERSKIEDTPTVRLFSEPGGRIRVRCSVAADSSRASMHPMADEIQLRIKIGDPAPASFEDCPSTYSSSSAIFDYQAGGANAGKRIYIYARYRNITNEAHSGEFGTASNIIIE
jgi:hypothetical protein